MSDLHKLWHEFQTAVMRFDETGSGLDFMAKMKAAAAWRLACRQQFDCDNRNKTGDENAKFTNAGGRCNRGGTGADCCGAD
jgi:hypothetical protein